MNFDFLVIGAGPIGSNLSSTLAEEGFNVCIFDRKKEIGEDVICSGIIGSRPYEDFNLPEEAVITEISSVKLLSPSLLEFSISRKEPFALIADRKKLDSELFKRAKASGAVPKINSMVIDLSVKKDGVEVKYISGGVEKKEFGRCVIITTGTNFSLHRKAGLIPPERFLWGTRSEYKGGEKGPVEIYILSNPDMGSFGWVIPLEDRIRIGTLSDEYDKSAFYNLLHKNNSRFDENLTAIEQAPVAFGEAKKMVNNRVLAAGEAAGQVKTTTGGGIHYGLIGASLASEILIEAARDDNFSRGKLIEYERKWRLTMSEQIKKGIKMRNILSKTPPKVIDNIFNRLNSNERMNDKVREDFCFDYHKDILNLGLDLLFGRSRTTRKSK